MLSFAVVVPTLNAGPEWRSWLSALQSQTLQPVRTIVVDSSSTDATAEISRAAGCEVVVIPRAEFNHGTTRQMAADLVEGLDLIIFMTQDAVLADRHALANLVAGFDTADVWVAYGRQLPHLDARPIGAHARLFNYSEVSETRSMADLGKYGLKLAFVSNSFAAYRGEKLREVGGFPSDNIFGEDTLVVAKMLLAGGSIAYRADARVYHSHDYSIMQDFRRYFDIGVFHSRESWLRTNFGGAEGEGKRFVLSELRFLASGAPQLVPSAIIRTAGKYLGYRLGLAERHFSLRMKRRLSMHRGYWAK